MKEKSRKMLRKNEIYNIDCLKGMQMLADKSVDMILCDLPYGMTSCGWDSVIPFELLWKQYKRIIKDKGAIVLTGIQPFTTKLISSNFKWFKYCWYWNKNQVTNFAQSKRQPLRCVEEIAVFYNKQCIYNPQGLVKLDKIIKKNRKKNDKEFVYSNTLCKEYESTHTNYPRQTLDFKCQREGLHPTQKPVKLFKYLIETYTNVGDLVLDNCIGSGTTAIACIDSNRNYIGFETENRYFNIAKERIYKHTEYEQTRFVA